MQDQIRASKAIADAAKVAAISGFTYFVGFEGTYNDQGNLGLSGSPYKTNVANLVGQARAADNPNLATAYYPGVGTGGDAGGIVSAGPLPTRAVEATAETAWSDFSKRAAIFLKENPDYSATDIGLASVGFSRGSATQARFHQLVETRGLIVDGDVVAPPGAVRIKAVGILDAVQTGVAGDYSTVSAAQNVVAVVAKDEFRAAFAGADYSSHPNVTVVTSRGNHADVGGGNDQNGIGASNLEGLTAFFQRSGIPIADVPAALRFNADTPAVIHSESYNTGPDGQRLFADGQFGESVQYAWSEARNVDGTRIMSPVPPPKPMFQGSDTAEGGDWSEPNSLYGEEKVPKAEPKAAHDELSSLLQWESSMDMAGWADRMFALPHAGLDPASAWSAGLALGTDFVAALSPFQAALDGMAAERTQVPTVRDLLSLPESTLDFSTLSNGVAHVEVADAVAKSSGHAAPGAAAAALAISEGLLDPALAGYGYYGFGSAASLYGNASY